MKIISSLILLIGVNFAVVAQNSIDVMFNDLKKSVKDKQWDILGIGDETSSFSVMKGKKYTFYDIPVDMLKLNNDFFLARKKIKAEYTFEHFDDGFMMYLSDSKSGISYRINVKSNAGEDFFVKFRHGRKNYFRIKRCVNCEFSITEEI